MSINDTQLPIDLTNKCQFLYLFLRFFLLFVLRPYWQQPNKRTNEKKTVERNREREREEKEQKRIIQSVERTNEHLWTSFTRKDNLFRINFCIHHIITLLSFYWREFLSFSRSFSLTMNNYTSFNVNRSKNNYNWWTNETFLFSCCFTLINVKFQSGRKMFEASEVSIQLQNKFHRSIFCQNDFIDDSKRTK